MFYDISFPALIFFVLHVYGAWYSLPEAYKPTMKIILFQSYKLIFIAKEAKILRKRCIVWQDTS